MNPSAATTPTPSPCINICRMDEASGWCEGCLRTLDEIACWSLLDDAEKTAVVQTLDERRVVWAQRAATQEHKP
jgi:predicted Fe-S protein YdhL (DUF1289 family)